MKKFLFLFICLFSLFFVFGCEEDHTHNYVDGKCECGDVDPNYNVHTHNYVDGKCECGDVDPNYNAHTHNYVDGVCSCGQTDPNIVIDYDKVITQCDLMMISDSEVREDLIFVKEQLVENVLVEFTYSSSDQSVITNSGEVILPSYEDATVTVTAKYSFLKNDGTLYESTEKVATFNVISMYTILEEVASEINIPEYVNDDIELPTKVGDIDIDWTSSKKNILSNKGVYKYVSEDVEVELSASFIYEGKKDVVFYDKTYDIIVGPYADSKCVELVIDAITMPEEFSGLALPFVTTNDYDAVVTWSSDSSYVDKNGKLVNLTSDQNITVKVVVTKGEARVEKSFDILVKFFEISHMFVNEAVNFDGSFNKTELVQGNLVLKAGETEGTYESNEFNVRDFTELVGSWNALTNANATCEYAISVKSNGVWSKYFTYGDWGLGKTNYYENQSDTYVKMNTDEILLNGSNVGTAVKFKVTLRRTSGTIETPKLARVAMTFLYKDYSYFVDVTGLPTSADYNVPRLYQYDVPTIGGSICSPTTTSMLLKYHGIDLSSSYQYEHQYMASLVADPGHNNPTYGNWSYNMAAAGAFGRKAYVMKMYSWEELQEYLAYNGPVGASIKGTFPGTKEDGSSYTYSTGGHLICVRGYRIEDGKTIVICNDPAVKGTYYEVSLATFMNCWRNTVYIVE